MAPGDAQIQKAELKHEAAIQTVRAIMETDPFLDARAITKILREEFGYQIKQTSKVSSIMSRVKKVWSDVHAEEELGVAVKALKGIASRDFTTGDGKIALDSIKMLDKLLHLHKIKEPTQSELMTQKQKSILTALLDEGETGKEDNAE